MPPWFILAAWRDEGVPFLAYKEKMNYMIGSSTHIHPTDWRLSRAAMVGWPAIWQDRQSHSLQEYSAGSTRNLTGRRGFPFPVPMPYAHLTVVGTDPP